MRMTEPAHQPAAKNPVELADAGKHPAFFSRVDLVDRCRVFLGAEAQFAARVGAFSYFSSAKVFH